MSAGRLVATAALTLAVVGCGYGSSSPATSPSPTPVAGGSATTIAIPSGAQGLGNRAYNPGNVTVPVGATVTWTNTDSVAHTSTADGGRWSSGTLGPGQQFSTTFSTAGTFAYHCTIHPGMVGTVTVQ